eukprot:UN20008
MNELETEVQRTVVQTLQDFVSNRSICLADD